MIGFLANIGFGIVDFLNEKLTPYPAFRRPFLPPETQTTLKEKAEAFYARLTGEFMHHSGLVLYNRAQPGEEPDYGDQAVHQGLATAALAVGFSIGDVNKADVAQAAAGQGLLYENGKLIRGRDPRNLTKIADDASNDSACGQLLGIYFSSKLGGPEPGVAGITHISLLADELISHDYALVKQDGTKTSYGTLINGMLTDPQRGSLCLAILKTAAIMTGSRVYRSHFDTLYRKYGSLLRFAAFKFLDYTKTHEMHRSAIQLTILADLAFGESPEMIERCAGGLERIWKLSREWRDPWIAALVNRHWKIPEAEMREVVLRLHEYPVSGKPGPRETINSRNAEYWSNRGVHFKEVNGHIRSTQPLPYHVLPTQDFWPQRHPYMCDGFEGSADTFVRHNPVDFLAPYWFLRAQGVIKGDE